MKYILLSIAALGLAACGGGNESAETKPSEASVDVAEAKIANVIASGEFSGRSDHITTGGVSLRKDDAGYIVVLADDFSLDGAPDPVLGFGNDGEYLEETEFSKLNSKTGEQSYRLPEGVDPSAHNEIYVWCKQFSVPLGVASLGQES